MIARDDVAGLILAGGMSRRFAGGAKDAALLGGKTLIDRVMERARSQVRTLAISRARAAPFGDRGLPIVEDIFENRGPLGGVHAGLLWAATLAPRPTHLATFPCDAPFLPDDLVRRLAAPLDQSQSGSAVAKNGALVHATFALWSLNTAESAAALLRSGPFSLVNFAREVGAVEVEFPDASGASFANINTAEDLDAHARRLRGGAPFSGRD
ncbi:MAG: molybdenum cofactor guanylyltransferase [Parvularculaceae bacterium]|nr:molybdenum cofactor guanylyltransferase [Parvularculaceae bacterium]